MENASKALQIAGGVLISLMVLGLLVFAYNNLSSYKSTEEKAKEEEQAEDFNKNFEVYNRNGVYGSELLSLANKIENYNKKEAGDKGYEEIILQVILKNATTIDGTTYIKKEYTAAADLTEDYQDISKGITDKGKTVINGKTIQQWAKLSDSTVRNSLTSEEHNEVNKYNQLVNLQSDLGRKRFNCTDVKNDTNGRIIKMIFTEVD